MSFHRCVNVVPWLVALTWLSSGIAAAADLTDPMLALADVPREVMADLGAGAKSIEAAAEKAAPYVAKTAEGKTASFKMTFHHFEKLRRPDSEEILALVIIPVYEKVREGGATFVVQLSAKLPPSAEKKVAKLRQNQKITVTGKVSKATIRSGHTMDQEMIAVLAIGLEEAEVK